MAKFGRPDDDGTTIATVIECDNPADVFHPDVAKLYVAVNDDAKPGDPIASVLPPRSSRRREKR